MNLVTISNILLSSLRYVAASEKILRMRVCERVGRVGRVGELAWRLRLGVYAGASMVGSPSVLLSLCSVVLFPFADE